MFNTEDYHNTLTRAKLVAKEDGILLAMKINITVIKIVKKHHDNDYLEVLRRVHKVLTTMRMKELTRG